MFLVYIREAHPEDGWAMKASDGLCYRQPKTLEARVKVASAFAERHAADFSGIPLLVDDPATNRLDTAFEAPPERLVVVDDDLRVVFASGQGPFQYDPASVEAFLKEHLQ